MAGKYYAVRIGKVPGIYMSWNDCKQMVSGFPGAVYKSFSALEDAEQFIRESPELEAQITDDYAFVDGSFCESTGVYGYGGFLVHNGKRILLQGHGQDPEMASMRNVAGEVLGSMAAMEMALLEGITELTIYYDYMGIEMWATGGWKRNKAGTIAYYDYVQSVKDKLNIRFVKVKGHSGVEGNEEADRLAKEAVGLR